MIGQVIGNYRIVSELGKGGMGMVYRAEHVQLGRPAALKMLLPQLSADPGIVQRFFNEARAASAIDHPGIVEVYDYGTHSDGAAYIVMALLKGETLEHRLRNQGALPPMEGASIVAQVLGALAAAHARGIVHRDLKPDNIFLTPNELMPGGIQVKLLDFGIAKLADDSGGSSGGFKTQTGMMMGTPAYMSPEQCMGRSDLDHRTDLYAIGCILFHVLIGRPPFVSDQGTGMMIAAQIRDAPPHPRSLNPNIPDSLASITMRLLEKEPAARYQTALEAREALVAAGAASPSRPPMPADGFAATMAPMPSMNGVPPTVPRGGPMPSYASPGQSPTTASGSAAQVMPMTTAPAAPAKSGKAGLVIGIGVLAAALGGAGVWFVQKKQGDAPSTAQSAGRPEVPPASVPAAPPPLPAGAPPTQPAPPERRPSERIQPVSTQPSRTPNASSTPAPSFTLDAKTYAPGDTIVITFADAVPSPSGARAWITVVDAKEAPSQYGAWSYIDDGARSIKLTAPDKPGSYEVRMHTDYPARPFNVRHTVAVSVAANANPKPTGATPRGDQRFMLAGKVAKVGEHIELTFPVPLKAADGEKFWVTVVAKGSADTAYGAYTYVPDGAHSMQFEMPATAGDYEIRLHANYPRLSTNLVHRAPIRVED